MFYQIENLDIIQNIAKYLIKNGEAKKIHHLRVSFRWLKEIDNYLLPCQKKAKRKKVLEKIEIESTLNIINEPLDDIYTLINGYPLDDLLPDILTIPNQYFLTDIIKYLVHNSNSNTNYSKQVGSILEGFKKNKFNGYTDWLINMDYYFNGHSNHFSDNTQYRRHIQYSRNIQIIIKYAIHYLSQKNAIDYSNIIIHYFHNTKLSNNLYDEVNCLVVNTIAQFSIIDQNIKNEYIPIITQFNNDSNYTISYLETILQYIYKLQLFDKSVLVNQIKEYYQTRFPPNYLGINTRNGLDISIPKLCERFLVIAKY